MKEFTREQKRRIQRARANIAGIAVIATIFAAGIVVGYGATTAGASAETEPAPSTASDSVHLVIEDPMEEEKIEAALIEQGYFRDDVPLSYELQDILHTACEANEIPYHVALGLIETESSFDTEAVSSAGCYGLCQLNPEYFPSDLAPAENITTGIEFLAYQLERYGGDMEAALTAYNAGHDTGARWYADAVLEAAEKWQ